MKSNRLLSIGLISILIFGVSASGTLIGKANFEDRRDINLEGVPFAGGNGTEEDPYLIENIDQLQDMNQNLSAHYRLISDIDASNTVDWNYGKGFMPISHDTEGGWGFQGPRFTGSLDGQGHNISGLYINRSGSNFIGMFGYVEENGSVHDVRLVDHLIKGKWVVGALVGVNKGNVTGSYADGKVDGPHASSAGGLVGYNMGMITDSHSAGKVNGTSKVGGLVGENLAMINSSSSTADVSGKVDIGGLVGKNDGTINNSYARGDVNGRNHLGGLVGATFDATIKNSYAAAEVTGYRNAYTTAIGGLVGNNVDSTVKNCFTLGMVSGDDYIGGVVGYNLGSISTSYAAAEVTGSDYTGGLTGKNDGSVNDCFWDINTTGQTSSEGGTGKTTAEMKDIETFTDESTEGLKDAWDFSGDQNDDSGKKDVWTIDKDGKINDGYPYIKETGAPSGSVVPDDKSNGSDDGDDSPGYSVFVLMSSIAIVVYIYRECEK